VTSVLDYRGFAVEPKRDFGPVGFYIDGRFVKDGFVVVKDGCNAMPGATWFRTIDSAKHAIDVFIDVDGDAYKFWTRLRGEA
jgi:hypothetical protein